MAAPDKPDLDYSYTGFSQALGNGSFPGPEIDNDLANLKQAIDETIDHLALAVRSDGKLQNGTVTRDALAADVLVGVPPPRPWLTATAYVLRDTVSQNNGLYICNEDHTSSVFAADLSAARWSLLIEFTIPSSIANGEVTEPKFATGAVSTRAQADGSTTTPKIADGAVTLPKLAPSVGVVPIGAEMDWSGPFEPSGWLFKFGQTLSRTTYSALFAALVPAVTGTFTLGAITISSVGTNMLGRGLEGAIVESPAVPSGTTIVSLTATTVTLSAAATANSVGAQFRVFSGIGRGDGSTTFVLPDDRDRVSVGRGNMGGSAAGRIVTTGAGASDLATVRLGSVGGVSRLALTVAELPAHAHGVTDAGHSHGVTDPGHKHEILPELAGTSAGTGNRLLGALSAASYGTANTASATTGVIVNSGTTGVSIGNTGSGDAHTNVQPSRAVNKIIFTGVV